MKDRYRQIGNAVPVSLGKAIGSHIQKLLADEPIEEFEDFNYSRYKNTSDIKFRELIRKREKVNKQPILDF